MSAPPRKQLRTKKMMPIKPSRPQRLTSDWISSELLILLAKQGIKTPVNESSLVLRYPTCKCGVFMTPYEKEELGTCQECHDLDKRIEARR